MLASLLSRCCCCRWARIEADQAARRFGGAARRKAKERPRTRMPTPRKGLTIAVEGCCHGELDRIYATLKAIEDQQGKKIDLLVCCGDFQAARNLGDLECMAVPPKYRKIMDFYKYYMGKVEAPYPTLFVGGNHEAINHLRELYYGGWVAKNIYFMGYAGVVNFGGLRFGGISGIFNERHYHMGHFERLPYTDSNMRSAYHVRELEVFRLKQIKRPLDVFVSHDWPRGIVEWGDKQLLINRKPFFKNEIDSHRLGSPVAAELLRALKPGHWFSAHLHVKFPAVVDHKGTGKITKFLALDKCLPKRDFIQLVNFPQATGPHEFSYDEEWLAVLRGTHQLMNVGRGRCVLPDMDGPSREDLEFVCDKLAAHGAEIPHNFERTAEPYSSRVVRPKGEPRHQRKPDGERSPQGGPPTRGRMPSVDSVHPQTMRFLNMLELPYNLHYGQDEKLHLPQYSAAGQGMGYEGPQNVTNPEEISLDEEDDVDDDELDCCHGRGVEHVDDDEEDGQGGGKEGSEQATVCVDQTSLQDTEDLRRATDVGL
ncbi:unnamed protein product [Ostreobium quekettii]|uniref:Lariat debranching enzyme C-terminal domain-containing protein n=1 Tax=Ostreobium quekettii TaxID=121088 RepID=A0A8S1ITX5_9CHLO|nr:unnamed protein product [Ostreobium quekettii]|eukprot:evm.model.scf_45.3 EVM.evm.TU.scf_45.3   scf_45:81664-87731(-)